MRRRSVILRLSLRGLVLAGLFASDLPSQTGLPRVLVWEEVLPESEEFEIRWPVAVAASEGGEIAVADAYGPVLSVFRRVGVSWQLRDTAAIPGTPHSMVWNGDRIVLSLREGQGLVSFEGPRLEPRRLTLPDGLVPGALAARPDGGLWVHDLNGNRIVGLGAAGEIAARVPLAERISGLAATPTGGFLATVAMAGCVLHYDGGGRLEHRWELPSEGPVPAWPVGVALDRGGRATVVDRHASRILVLDTEGRVVGTGSRRGWEPGLVFHPGAVAQLPDGRIVVADEGNGRVQVFRRTDRGGGS